MVDVFIDAVSLPGINLNHREFIQQIEVLVVAIDEKDGRT